MNATEIGSARLASLIATATWVIAGVSPSSPVTMEPIVSNVSLSKYFLLSFPTSSLLSISQSKSMSLNGRFTAQKSQRLARDIYNLMSSDYAKSLIEKSLMEYSVIV